MVASMASDLSRSILDNQPLSSGEKTALIRTKCPVEDCTSVVGRIDRHLQSVHHFARYTDDYRTYYQLSRREEYQVKVEVNLQGGRFCSGDDLSDDDDDFDSEETQEDSSENPDISDEDFAEASPLSGESSQEISCSSVFSEYREDFELWLERSSAGGRRENDKIRVSTSRIKRFAEFVEWNEVSPLRKVVSDFDMRFIPHLEQGDDDHRPVGPSSVICFLNAFLKFCH